MRHQYSWVSKGVIRRNVLLLNSDRVYFRPIGNNFGGNLITVEELPDQIDGDLFLRFTLMSRSGVHDEDRIKLGVATEGKTNRTKESKTMCYQDDSTE